MEMLKKGMSKKGNSATALPQSHVVRPVTKWHSKNPHCAPRWTKWQIKLQSQNLPTRESVKHLLKITEELGMNEKLPPTSAQLHVRGLPAALLLIRSQTVASYWVRKVGSPPWLTCVVWKRPTQCFSCPYNEELITMAKTPITAWAQLLRNIWWKILK